MNRRKGKRVTEEKDGNIIHTDTVFKKRAG